MSDVRYPALLNALDALKQQMQLHELWALEAPSQKALASTQPFCVDTLEFEQWLQFVMVPTFLTMIERAQALPNQCDIHTMAEHIWQQRYSTVQQQIKRIDTLISGGSLRPPLN